MFIISKSPLTHFMVTTFTYSSMAEIHTHKFMINQHTFSHTITYKHYKSSFNHELMRNHNNQSFNNYKDINHKESKDFSSLPHHVIHLDWMPFLPLTWIFQQQLINSLELLSPKPSLVLSIALTFFFSNSKSFTYCEHFSLTPLIINQHLILSF